MTDQDVLQIISRSGGDGTLSQLYIQTICAFITNGEHPLRAIDLAIMICKQTLERSGAKREAYVEAGVFDE